MTNSVGLYIHVPFCLSKCPYCDFYSVKPDAETADAWRDAVCDELTTGRRTGSLAGGPFVFDTVYFGGGTPSAVGARRLAEILEAACRVHSIAPGAEITAECNPSSADDRFVREAAKAGINRLSVGLQSAIDDERRRLGRRSGADEAKRVLDAARGAGIDRLSLDVMLGIPRQTRESLARTLAFCRENAGHVSAYLLTLEEGTPFYDRRDRLALPDEDESAALYLALCGEMTAGGFTHYEISNFALPGQASRHNLKYWNGDEYLGVGPAAHSFLNGKRFGYDRSLSGFLAGKAPDVYDDGGDPAEYVMLRLRLGEGVRTDLYEARCGAKPPEAFFRKAREYARLGLARVSPDSVSLTDRGMLLSNGIIAALTETIEAG